MHTIIPSLSPSDLATTECLPAYRQPHFECTDLPSALKLVVLVPGVEANGMEITTCGPDLLVTASKAHIVRVNWQALHLEGVQRDYQLRLRLGNGLDYDALNAELVDGRLTLTLPKKMVAETRERRVA